MKDAKVRRTFGSSLMNNEALTGMGDLNKAYRGQPWRWLRGRPRLLPQMVCACEALVRPPRAILG